MEVKDRISLEVKAHRKSIEYYISENIRYKKDIDMLIKRVKGTGSREQEMHDWGMIYSTSDRICKYLKNIKDLQDLITVKLPLVVDKQPLKP